MVKKTLAIKVGLVTAFILPVSIIAAGWTRRKKVTTQRDMYSTGLSNSLESESFLLDNLTELNEKVHLLENENRELQDRLHEAIHYGKDVTSAALLRDAEDSISQYIEENNLLREANDQLKKRIVSLS